MTFIVEWSDSLQSNNWRTDGILDTLDPVSPGSSELENRIATMPPGETGRRFIRLRVNQP